MPKDFRGQEIEVGDRAIYVYSYGSGLLRSIVEVLDVKTKVKVGIFRQGKLVNQKWTNGESLCCVEYLKGEFVPGVTGS